MGTRSCIGYKGENGKIAYVICRYDGYLEHVGRILEEHYNDMEKVLKLLQGGDIVSLRDDPKLTERERPFNYEQLEEYKVKIVDGVGEYFLIGDCDYKYIFDGGRWYVIDGLRKVDGMTPILRPMLLAKALEMSCW